MLISCPSCSTRFAIPDTALGDGGRNLKCARCGHKWFQPPITDAPVPAAPPPLSAKTAEPAFVSLRDASAPPSLPALDDVPEPPLVEPQGHVTDAPPPRLDRLGLPPTLMAPLPARPRSETASAGRGGLAWAVAAALVVAGSLAAAYAFQSAVVAALPAAEPVYTALGLRERPLGAGLAFRNYSSERLVDGAKEILVVRGVIANTTERSLDLPYLRLSLLDGQTVLQEKILPPPAPALDPGGTVAFKITLDQPDGAARRFEVEFTPPPAAAE